MKAKKVTLFKYTSPTTMITAPLVTYETKCCNDPVNWQGIGEFGAIWPLDPAYWHGAKSARGVECAVCHTALAASEYSIERVSDSVMVMGEEPYADSHWWCTKEAVEQCVSGPLPYKGL